MVLPQQKLSRAEKLVRFNGVGKNNIEETADYYISTCSWSKLTEEILSLYKAVEGYLDQADYKLLQNPYGKATKDGAPPKFNATLQNYNILKGIVNLLMGEFGRRAHDYTVASINPSDEMTFKQGLDILIKDYNAQRIVNELNKSGINTGQSTKEVPADIEEYLTEYKQTFDETRLISGQEILDFIRYNCDLDAKFLDAYYDWIITGSTYTFKTVNHDDVYYEIVPPHEIFVPNEKHSRLVEDASYVVRRQIMPVFKVVDFFRGRMEDELVDALEDQLHNGLNLNFANVQMVGRQGAIILPTQYVSANDNTGTLLHNNGIEVFHVEYDTWRKYGVLTYTDPFLGEQEMEVGEDYKLNKEQGDIKIKWQWEKEKYSVWRVLDFYLDEGPLKTNRADLNQEGLQKSSYNGIRERSIDGSIQSIVKEGLPFQRIVNVLHFQTEKLINKNKDKLLVMPYGMINRKNGMDTKETMYHADATSILWVDETAPGAQYAAQMIKSVDMSMGNYIKDVIGLIQFIKQEYWDAIGMNAQRYADVGANAGKAVTEQAIVRSAIITYELTRQFEFLIQKDYTGLLDLSKQAYINGKKAKYVRSDSSISWLQMNQDGAIYHSESSYNVFVVDSSISTEALQHMQQQGLNLIQNGGDMSVIGKLWSTKSIPKLTKILEKLEDNKKQYEQLVAKNQSDAAMQLQQAKNENDQAERDIEIYKSDNLLEGVKYTADSKAESNNSRDEPRPANDVERELAQHKIQSDNKKAQQEDEKIKIAAKQKKETSK